MAARHAVLALSLLLAAEVGPAQSMEGTEGIRSLRSMEDAFRTAARTAIPAVVAIETTTAPTESSERLSPFFFFFGPGDRGAAADQDVRRSGGRGSGVIVRTAGEKVYVLTTSDVVSDAAEVRVRTTDGRRLDAELVGRDRRRNLALLSFESTEPVTVAVLGDSDSVKVGEWALAVGGPVSAEPTVAVGVVSALVRHGATVERLRTDAAVTAESSGGPIVNLAGEVIAIGVWQAGTPGERKLSEAIPVNLARRAVDDFISQGRITYGWLGINAGDPGAAVRDQIRVGDTPGAMVYGLFRQSPAARAGILPGDFIIAVDGRQVDGAADLLAKVGELVPEQVATFRLVRTGMEMHLPVIVAARDDERQIAVRGGQLWPGVLVVPLSEEIRTQLKLSRSLGELVVAGVAAGSPAGQAGLRPGDIIGTVGGTSVRTVADFYRQVNGQRDGDLVVAVYREGVRFTASMNR